MNVSDLQQGDVVFHQSWDPRTSEPMTVVDVDGELMLELDGMECTGIQDGGESDDGWEII